MESITQSAAETQRFASEVANTLVQSAKDKKNGIVIALTGDLGAGKTTFVQGFAKALGVKQRIISPTFILMRRYALESGMLFHLDAYRIYKNEEEEVKNLGLSEIWNTPGNIVLIEWAEKIKEFLPQNTIWISFEYLSETERGIRVGTI